MTNNQINIVIPMAGRGQRFLDQGYKTPKPLLEVNGKTMIEWVVKSMHMPGAKYVFIIRKDHEKDYDLKNFLVKTFPNSEIVVIDKLTDGALCTVLLAKKHIDNDTPIIIKDCDQIIDWSPSHFLKHVKRNSADGAIVTIATQKSNYSYAKLGKDNKTVIQTAEKMVISPFGAAGVYYFGKGSDLVKYAQQMIDKNIRTNNEFYVCPVYNEFIEDGKVIHNYPIAQIFGLNTPEEFEKEKDEAIKIFED